MENELKRVWVVLQQEEYSSEVFVVGVYDDDKVARKVMRTLNKKYTQRYYIQDAILNQDLWTRKKQ